MSTTNRDLESMIGETFVTVDDGARYGLARPFRFFTISPADIAKVKVSGKNVVASRFEYVFGNQKMTVVGVSDASITFILDRKRPLPGPIKRIVLHGVVYLLYNEKVLCCTQTDFRLIFLRGSIRKGEE